MEPVKNSGTLSEISSPRLLAYLHRTRFDGTLRISRGALLKLLYFQSGEIAMASSNDQGDHLAPILIRAGKLKPEQMDLARKSTKAGTSLARILVQMGFLTSGELFAGARQQLRQIVGSVMGMTDASYEIQGGFFPREITSLNVNTREMFLDLVRDLADRSFVLLEVGAPDTLYVPVKQSGNGDEGLKLPRAWKEHADRFSAPLAIHEFGQMSSLDDFSASKVVYGLSLFGCVAPKPDEASLAPTTVMVTSVAPAELPEPVSPSQPMDDEETPDAPPQDEASEALSDATAPPAIAEVESIPTFRERFHSAGPLSESHTPAPEPPAPAPPILQPAGDTFRDFPAATTAFPGVDKVSDGKPIRLEFKGPFAERLPPVRPSRPWATASILGGLCVLALTSYWFVFLRGPESTPLEAPAAAASPALSAPSEEATSEGSPADGSVQTEHSVQPEPSSTGDDTAPAVQEPPAQEPSLPPPATNDTPEKVAAAPSSSQSPQPPTPAPQATSIPVPAGFRAARSRLDSGEYATAAQSWAGILAGEGRRSFTIQIAIACQEGSLKKAARRTSESDPLFVLPFSLGGRPCYRLCWGLYANLEAAQSSRSAVPSFFLEEGGQPVVVSLQKALPPEGR
jgi:hypothetical protein